MHPTPVCQEDTYQNLYQQHFKSVRNFIYYKCGDLDLSEDLAQESFIKMWENCADVLIDKVKGFLYTVAGRLFLNNQRHQKVHLTFSKHIASVNNAFREERPDFKLEEKQFKARLEKAISELPEGQREVFLMNRIDKLTFVEIANILGISVKAVEKRMSICLRTLKDKVSELNLYKI